MATYADSMLESAIEGLMAGDLALIKGVVRRDDALDRMEATPLSLRDG